MGSVSGLTAFSIVFLSLAMLIFWSVTDLSGNEAVQQQMLKFQAKEIANDIELVADYENEGYAEVVLGSNYTFRVGADPSSPGPHVLEMSIGGNSKTVDLNVQLEDQNTGGGSMSEFSAKQLCIYEDYHRRHYPASPFSWLNYQDIYDPEDSNPNDGSVESDDPYVQIYPGECVP